MKKQISYPSIEQFRNVCSGITRRVTFDGFDKDGNAIINPLAKKPILTFKGTVKLHGTNAGVSYNTSDGIWAQSRENIITVEKDNAGFAFFIHNKQHVFLDFIGQLSDENDINLAEYTITIYGEWLGKGIQKGVAISNIDKSFFIFGAKVSKPHDEAFNAYWIDSSKLSSSTDSIYNVEDYKTFSIDIDFNMPQLSQNKLIELTEAVEKECPIGRALGFIGIGEGIVFSAEYKGVCYRFKSKGEKHSASKVKTLNSIDVEKLNSINEFIEYAVTESRFNQAIQSVFIDEQPSVKGIADIMRWMVSDILKEELDVLSENGIEPKEIGKYVSNKVRGMFFELLDKQEFAS